MLLEVEYNKKKQEMRRLPLMHQCICSVTKSDFKKQNYVKCLKWNQFIFLMYLIKKKKIYHRD